MAGTGLLGLAILSHLVPVMIAGGAAVFTGLLLVGPVLMPALVRFGGLALRPVLGMAGRLAAANAVRNPRRTAATTASLLVGVTLTTAVLTGLASSRVAVDAEMDRSHPLDATLTAMAGPLSAGLVDDVRTIEGVDRAVAVEGVAATVSDDVGPLPVLTPPATAADVSRSALAVAPGELRLPPASRPTGLKAGDRVTVTVGRRTAELVVRNGEGWGGAALVAPETLRRLSDRPDTRAVWVRAREGFDAEEVTGRLQQVAGPAGAEVSSSLTNRAWVTQQLDILALAMVALLGIAVVIALVGIGNTLGLSVLERVREHALLAGPRADPRAAAGDAGGRGDAGLHRGHRAGDGRRRAVRLGRGADHGPADRRGDAVGAALGPAADRRRGGRGRRAAGQRPARPPRGPGTTRGGPGLGVTADWG